MLFLQPQMLTIIKENTSNTIHLEYNIIFSPEQATKQHTVFTVCNQFVFQIYNQALGMEIPDTTETTMEYAKKYKDNKELILYYFDNAEDIYSDDWLGNSVSNVENLVNNLEKELEIGDVINIRRDNNTVML